ncbi:UDP-N-acetylmuramoyl-tripeptide--D-alanyl-D-alanine ligase [Catelliglobosispora koreensis]|uniref:UDP-N-acetylmuramoyl-tripeptide--D-alanyl-D- alanine ligase n=1 Tax=Catelliglobosispora koreensis TaxID=129052 RepID=UPI00035EFB0C|nr:UDP-N-acetylmuramoyl-tripeptide--D-alanyl-D-alanine ligase [Catelliglobosispora koreensis]
MIAFRLSEIASITGGVLHGQDVTVTGDVEFDSREILPGGMFVAFEGAKVDGHDFAGKAKDLGAVAVLGSKPVPQLPTVVVGDPRAAMGLLARALLGRLPELTVIGITGSSGKTSTKDMIGQLLSRLGTTIAPAGSFNNELGLPHTVLRADARTKYLVLEMGSRGPGHLTYLCGIAPPKIGVVVNVGVAHLGEFGSVEAIAKAKSELIQALPADGFAVLNGDDPAVAAMAAVSQAPVKLVTTGEVELDSAGRPSFDLNGTRVRLALTGVHQAGNALLAAAVAQRCGMPLADLPQALAELKLISARRMDVFDRADGVTVIDDSYNANPASTAAALRALAAAGKDRRTIAVLGYHAELGAAEREGHAEVGALAAALGVDVLIAVEESAAPILDGAASVRSWEGESVLVSDQAAAVAEVARRLRPGDVVLVKGSRYRTWDVADFLRAPAA